MHSGFKKFFPTHGATMLQKASAIMPFDPNISKADPDDFSEVREKLPRWKWALKRSSSPPPAPLFSPGRPLSGGGQAVAGRGRVGH